MRRPFATLGVAAAAMLAVAAAGLTLARAAPDGNALQALAPVEPVVDCSALAGQSLGQIAGTEAKITEAAPGGPAAKPYCRVKGVVAPAILFEVHLPLHGWTQRYVQNGCGGLCGNLQVHLDHAETCAPAQGGELAVASTDMGHERSGPGPDGDAGFGRDPQLRIDFAYRGMHATALAAKAVIARYYGRGPKFSYFSGCSDGGREALMEAQRYPKDFDGITAGAPAMNFQVQNTFYHAWQALSNTGADGKAILTADKLPVLHAAAVAACDAADGLKDGQISDPRACRFDPGVTQCKAGSADTKDCLTPAQVEVARKFYAGPRDAAGHRFTIGGPQVGSELAWRGVYVPDAPDGMLFSNEIATGTVRHVAYAQNPPAGFELKDFRFDRATFAKLDALDPLYDSVDPDLGPFERAGGKLILWHGWSDPHISPVNTIAYDEAVKRTLGEAAAAHFLRLFLFPGMYHCAGGDGPSQFDVLTPVMAWVESGRAPEVLIAGRPMGNGQRPPRGPNAPDVGQPAPTDRTRPVFAYPAVARYSGQGDVNDAASFVAGPAIVKTQAIAWEGARFVVAGRHAWCQSKDGALACKPTP